MKFLKKLFKILFVLVLAAAGCMFYAFKIEPYRITVNEYTLNDKQNEALEIKIVQISDLHIKEDFTYQNLSKVVDKINMQNPDIVIFTGDLYDNYAKYRDDNNIASELLEIKAKYAKIAIWGNHDYGGGAVRKYETIMENAGFTLLTNSNKYIILENGKEILLTGLDDALLGQPSMPHPTQDYEPVYDILLTHEPDIADDYLDYNYDLLLSGHSHGGQVNVPFLPFINKMAVDTARLSSKYSRGIYIFERENIQKIYVNTGIGTTFIPVRFGVTPEIALFHIYV